MSTCNAQKISCINQHEISLHPPLHRHFEHTPVTCDTLCAQVATTSLHTARGSEVRRAEMGHSLPSHASCMLDRHCSACPVLGLQAYWQLSVSRLRALLAETPRRSTLVWPCRPCRWRTAMHGADSQCRDGHVPHAPHLMWTDRKETLGPLPPHTSLLKALTITCAPPSLPFNPLPERRCAPVEGGRSAVRDQRCPGPRPRWAEPWHQKGSAGSQQGERNEVDPRWG